MATDGGDGGMDPGRVAEVLVGRPGGDHGRRGTGYRVGTRWVLTAGHVVAGATGQDVVRVRFDADRPGAWLASARVVLASGPAADVALLEITGDPPPGGPVPAPRYAAVPDGDVVLPASAMGFPRFKVREDRMRRLDDGSPAQYRDSCHATGTISALSNRRTGTLELTVTPPGTDPDPDRSPWEGMSGAAVWSAGSLVGVVTEHHRRDGPGRLTAGRIDRWYDLLAPAELDLLCRLAGLPADAGSLGAPPRPDVPSDGVPGPLSGLTPAVPLRELNGLVTVLCGVPTLRDTAGRAVLLDLVRPEIAANYPSSPAQRIDLLNIAATCLHYPGALDELVAAARMLADGSVAVAELDREVAGLARRYPAGAPDRGAH